ncbi:MAG: BamA/TamA family outer membrane protein [Verrucomicrobiales bacterium]|nr:BamA/TamA family outer membrane protein [Verrucomicrobiales bacterium]
MFRLLAMVAGTSVVASAAPGREFVRIQGLQSVSPDQASSWISSQLKYVESSGVTGAKADDLAYFLENAMREQGFREATVDWKLEGSGENTKIILTASEGNSLMVGAIDITGNDELEDAAVIELLTALTRKRLEKKPEEAIPYVARDIEQGRAKVASFYRLLGFRKVEVDLTPNYRDGKANLSLTVVEGIRSQVGKIAFPVPPTPVVGKTFPKIESEFSGKTFTGAVPGTVAARVKSAAVNAGYFYAKIEAEESGSLVVDGIEHVDLVVNASWGAPVGLSGLNVEGNEKVKDEFFAKHFGGLIDRPYSPTETNKAVEELLQTGAFETVRTDLAEQPDGTYLLDIDVQEGYSRTLGVYGGFTNYEGPVAGFEFRNLNLFGTVRKIDSAIEFSKRGGRGEIEYSDPWFLDTKNQFRGALFALNRSEEGYEKFKTGGRYELSRKFGKEKKDSIALFGEAAYTDVHDADIDPVFLGDRKYFSSQIGISLTHDRRDNPRRPRKGYIAQTSLSTATDLLGSEVEYLKATGRLGYYLPVGDNTLRLGARAGMISPTGDTAAIPIDLRYFSGGPDSVRSFQERSLGLHDPTSGDPVGGNFYTLFNVEYEVPLPLFDGLSIVPFADAGNLLFDDSDASLDDLRYAIGLGLRYETPIGPLRAEYGFNPDQRPGEPQGTFHVGFGFAY